MKNVYARVVRDSVAQTGARLTTMELNYWLMIHNEDLRHRTHWSTDSMKFEQWLDSANSVASNRALAPAKIREQVVNDPYVPVFVSPTKGMIGGDELADQNEARAIWLWTRDQMVAGFDKFETNVRVHKQHRNRLLAPWQYVTVVKTANEQWWRHFFALRDHPAAQPDFQIVAKLAREAYNESIPRTVHLCEWHLPFVDDTEVSYFAGQDIVNHHDPYWTVKRLSIARCARTSFLRQGEILSNRDDMRLFIDLHESVPPHESPEEHVATPLESSEVRAGVFVGWASFRHF